MVWFSQSTQHQVASQVFINHYIRRITSGDFRLQRKPESLQTLHVQLDVHIPNSEYIVGEVSSPSNQASYFINETLTVSKTLVLSTVRLTHLDLCQKNMI